jgi:hypothetical protein
MTDLAGPVQGLRVQSGDLLSVEMQRVCHRPRRFPFWIGLTYVAVNFLTDVLYSLANPRIKQ